MSLQSLKNQFPLAYQCYLYVKESINVYKQKKEAKRIHNLSDEKIKMYNAHLYEIRQGKKLDWNNLETYTEKMQWAKIYDNDPLKVICADKYAVRKWVADRIGEEYLIPLLGMWEKYSDIDFKSLPEQFVLKTNHGSGDAVVVKQKSNMKLEKKIEMRRKIVSAMQTDYGTKHCEFHYSKIKPVILVEQYIDSGQDKLCDYKFLCFDGVPYFCWVDVDRFTNHKRNIYDMEWKKQKWNQREYGTYDEELPKPDNFEKMERIATVLSQGFSHVRVDLYNVNGKIYFGEMTFTNGSGFERIHPESADYMLGQLWKIEMDNK